MKTVWDNINFFEELIAEYAGSKYAVAVDSCTNALFLSLKLYQHEHPETIRDNVTIPSKTYISVPMQVLHSGYRVTLKDIQWTGVYQLDPLPIYDSAQRFTRDMYTPGSLYCLSFHSKKILSIGRGGMILTDSEYQRDWLRGARYDGRESIYYNDISDETVPRLGWHMYMSPEEAVRGIEQFYNIQEINKDSGGSDNYNIDLSKLNCLQHHVQ